MHIIEWQGLDATGRLAALARPPALTSAEVVEQARAIVATVRSAGDAALLRYAQQYDGATLTQLQVTRSEQHFLRVRGGLTVAEHRLLGQLAVSGSPFNRSMADTQRATDAWR